MRASLSLYHDTSLPIFVCFSFLSLGDLLCNCGDLSLSLSGVSVWVQGTEFVCEDDEEEEEPLAVAELRKVLDRAHAAFPTNHSFHRAPSCVSLISKSLFSIPLPPVKSTERLNSLQYYLPRNMLY